MAKEQGLGHVLSLWQETFLTEVIKLEAFLRTVTCDCNAIANPSHRLGKGPLSTYAFVALFLVMLAQAVSKQQEENPTIRSIFDRVQELGPLPIMIRLFFISNPDEFRPFPAPDDLKAAVELGVNSFYWESISLQEVAPVIPL
jgi:hypothetical protein